MHLMKNSQAKLAHRLIRMQIFLSASEHSEQHKSTSLKENTLVNVSFHQKNSDDAHAFF